MLKESKKAQRPTDTLIGQGAEFEGRMEGQANLRIEGQFKGEIVAAGDVIIGEKGVAHSNISAQNVIIAGKVIGDVATKGKLILLTTGQLCGNYSGPSLIIHEGADFNGSSQMEKGPAAAPLHKEPETTNEKSAKNKKQAG